MKQEQTQELKSYIDSKVSYIVGMVLFVAGIILINIRPHWSATGVIAIVFLFVAILNIYWS